MRLTDRDREMLSGTDGEATRIAMELLIAVGESQGAPFLIDIEGAHIDGCLYHGRAGLDFAERLRAGDGRVKVPTTLNVSSLDLLHPHLYRGDAETAALASRLMDAYVAMGCRETWTCAPYQLSSRPAAGAQVAWGESNAIVFANSVLGARTNRYGDFMDICCALTGRAPHAGLHTDEGRRGTLLFELSLPDDLLDDDLAYVLIGHHIGRRAGSDVPVLLGLDDRADEDRLKALGAAAASSGSVAMFHAVGVTPEAPDLDTALGGTAPTPTQLVAKEHLRQARAELDSGRGPLGAVSVGTPHMSAAELRQLATLAGDRRTRVPFYVSTGRDTILGMTDDTTVQAIERFGATVVTDTCTYITPILGPIEGDVLTNSGKWAYYAPSNLGVTVRLGTLAECVESAVTGRLVRSGAWA